MLVYQIPEKKIVGIGGGPHLVADLPVQLLVVKIHLVVVDVIQHIAFRGGDIGVISALLDGKGSVPVVRVAFQQMLGLFGGLLGAFRQHAGLHRLIRGVLHRNVGILDAQRSAVSHQARQHLVQTLDGDLRPQGQIGLLIHIGGHLGCDFFPGDIRLVLPRQAGAVFQAAEQKAQRLGNFLAGDLSDETDRRNALQFGDFLVDGQLFGRQVPDGRRSAAIVLEGGVHLRAQPAAPILE